jgi:uncharacterized protein YuzE
MKLHYYPETDSLYIDLATAPSVDSQQIGDDMVVDYDENGNIVGFDIQHASEHMDLSTVEVEHLPLALSA